MAIGGLSVLVLSMDEAIASDVANILEDANAQPHIVTDHYRAAQTIEAEPFDVVVADSGPESDEWYEVLIAMRRDTQLPFIMLVPGSEAVADCLALGADDCMSWPCSPSELVARIAARAHPPANGAGALLEFGDLSIDCGTHEVCHGGQRIHLTPKEYELLVYLARAPGRTFTKEQILQGVWHSASQFQGIHTVPEHVYRLRRKLGDLSGNTTWIVTVGRNGYQFDGAGV